MLLATITRCYQQLIASKPVTLQPIKNDFATTKDGRLLINEDGELYEFIPIEYRFGDNKDIAIIANIALEYLNGA